VLAVAHRVVIPEQLNPALGVADDDEHLGVTVAAVAAIAAAATVAAAADTSRQTDSSGRSGADQELSSSDITYHRNTNGRIIYKIFRGIDIETGPPVATLLVRAVPTASSVACNDGRLPPPRRPSTGTYDDSW
jgi:hypothetical protein